MCSFPLLAFMIPLATLAWLGIAGAGSGPKARMARSLSASLLIAVILSVSGEWVQGMYGLDPPYSLFFLGTAMQLVAFAIPIALAVVLAVQLAAWWRRRGNPVVTASE